MDQSTLRPAEGEQRMLAAIIMSDIVGYTKMVHKNESAAIRLARRDLAIFKDLCERYDGAVLKNTGDGLLMCFTSAVQAVNCAKAIQKSIHDQNKTLSEAEILQHRMGLHVGDVVVTSNDVFGDAVNAANRLQSEARPGAICLSEAAMESVRGKVDVGAKYVGLRSMKHLIDPIKVWMIPAVDAEEQLQKAIASGLARDPVHAAPADVSPTGTRLAIMIVAISLLLVIPVFLFIKVYKPTQISKPAPKIAKDASKDAKPSEQETIDAVAPSLSDDSALKQAITQYSSVYQFSGMVEWLRTNGYAEKAGGEALIRRYEDLAAFWTFADTAVRRATLEAPISFSDGGGVQRRVWWDASGAALEDSGQGPVPFALESQPPATVIALAEAFSATGASTTPKVAVEGWIKTFKDEYGLAAAASPSAPGA